MGLRCLSIEELVFNICWFVFRTVLHWQILSSNDLHFKRIEIMPVNFSKKWLISRQGKGKCIDIENTYGLALKGKLNLFILTFGCPSMTVKSEL